MLCLIEEESALEQESRYEYDMNNSLAGRGMRWWDDDKSKREVTYIEKTLISHGLRTPKESKTKRMSCALLPRVGGGLMLMLSSSLRTTQAVRTQAVRDEVHITPRWNLMVPSSLSPCHYNHTFILFVLLSLSWTLGYLSSVCVVRDV